MRQHLAKPFLFLFKPVFFGFLVSLCNLGYAEDEFEGELGPLFYQYTNDDGVVSLDNHVPPQHAHRGYKIMNAHGRVIKIIPRAPTAEEKRQLEIKRKKERAQREAAERQAEADELLLRRFSTVEEIEKARKRKRKLIINAIRVAESDINGIRNKIAEQQKKAAQFERQGKTVPEITIEHIKNLKEEAGAIADRIKLKKQELKTVNKEFDQFRKRLLELRQMLDNSSE